MFAHVSCFLIALVIGVSGDFPTPSCVGCAAGDDTSLLQSRHIASHKVADEEAMLEIIDHAFADVGASGRGPVLTEAVRQIQTTFNDNQYLSACLTADVTGGDLDDPNFIQAIYRQIGIKDCDSSHVCDAIQATAKAFHMLQSQFSSGPRFHNAMMINWGDDIIPSWADGTAEMSGPNQATIIDPNGANSYAVCEMARVVVQGTEHQQQSETCGWTSLLEQAILNQPAELFRALTRLMWVGRISDKFSLPCPSVFGLQVGLRGSSSGQMFGIEWMWTSSLLSSMRQKMGLSCEVVPQLLYPMNDPREELVSHWFEQSIPAEIAHTAELLYGSKPRVYTDWDRVCPAGGTQEDCRAIMTSIKLYPYGALKAQEDMKQGKAWSDIIKDPNVALTARQISQILHAPNTPETFNTGAGYVLHALAVPGLSDQQLTKACEAAHTFGKGLSLCVNAEAMFPKAAGGSDTGSCDHWVVMTGCRGNAALIWTWGYISEISFENVKAMSCDFIAMDVKLP